MTELSETLKVSSNLMLSVSYDNKSIHLAHRGTGQFFYSKLTFPTLSWHKVGQNPRLLNRSDKSYGCFSYSVCLALVATKSLTRILLSRWHRGKLMRSSQR